MEIELESKLWGRDFAALYSIKGREERIQNLYQKILVVFNMTVCGECLNYELEYLQHISKDNMEWQNKFNLLIGAKNEKEKTDILMMKKYKDFKFKTIIVEDNYDK